jgi:hypothetical protein
MEIETPKEEKKPPGFDYQNTAFYLMRPHSMSVIEAYKIKNKAEHAALIKKAVDLQLYVWYSKADEPKIYIVDFDSIPEIAYTNLTKHDISKLICPRCGKSLKSKSGYTLHMKQIHG